MKDEALFCPYCGNRYEENVQINEAQQFEQQYEGQQCAEQQYNQQQYDQQYNQQYNQQQYSQQYNQQPQMYYNAANQWQNQDEKPMSVGDWLITLIVMSIPMVNLIMLFIWGFGEGNKNRQNYCRAYLIFTVAIFLISIFFIMFIVFAASMSVAEFY